MKGRAVAGFVLGLCFLAVFTAVILQAGLPVPGMTPVPVLPGRALWGGRTYEVLIQGVILLAGVLAIPLLLGIERKKEAEP